MLDDLMKNFWFEDVNSIDKRYTSNQYEGNKLIEYIRQFQNGNFQSKKEFRDYFLYSTDQQIFVLGMRLFMTVADHKDFKLLEDFLGNCDEWQLRTFLTYVQESLSLHAIPYLLALFEDWEETYAGKDIARCICAMLGQRYYEEKEYNVEELGTTFVEFTEKHDLSLFYYKGVEYFAGDLTKTLITVMMDCCKKGKAFYTDQIPSILSNSSGLKCPVSYGTIINQEKIIEVYGYAEAISKKNNERGKKYFYNYKIQ